MSTEELTEQQFAIENAEECLMDIETLEWKMPLDALIEYAEDNNLHLAVAGLEELKPRRRSWSTAVRTCCTP